MTELGITIIIGIWGVISLMGFRLGFAAFINQVGDGSSLALSLFLSPMLLIHMFFFYKYIIL